MVHVSPTFPVLSSYKEHPKMIGACSILIEKSRNFPNILYRVDEGEKPLYRKILLDLPHMKVFPTRLPHIQGKIYRLFYIKLPGIVNWIVDSAAGSNSTPTTTHRSYQTGQQI